MLHIPIIGFDAILCSHIIIHHYEREVSIEGVYYDVNVVAMV